MGESVEDVDFIEGRSYFMRSLAKELSFYDGKGRGIS